MNEELEQGEGHGTDWDTEDEEEEEEEEVIEVPTPPRGQLLLTAPKEKKRVDLRQVITLNEPLQRTAAPTGHQQVVEHVPNYNRNPGGHEVQYVFGPKDVTMQNMASRSRDRHGGKHVERETDEPNLRVNRLVLRSAWQDMGFPEIGNDAFWIRMIDYFHEQERVVTSGGYVSNTADGQPRVADDQNKRFDYLFSFRSKPSTRLRTQLTPNIVKTPYLDPYYGIVEVRKQAVRPKGKLWTDFSHQSEIIMGLPTSTKARLAKRKWAMINILSYLGVPEGDGGPILKDLENIHWQSENGNGLVDLAMYIRLAITKDLRMTPNEGEFLNAYFARLGLADPDDKEGRTKHVEIAGKMAMQYMQYGFALSFDDLYRMMKGTSTVIVGELGNGMESRRALPPYYMFSQGIRQPLESYSDDTRVFEAVTVDFQQKFPFEWWKTQPNAPQWAKFTDDEPYRSPGTPSNWDDSFNNWNTWLQQKAALESAETTVDIFQEAQSGPPGTVQHMDADEEMLQLPISSNAPMMDVDDDEVRIEEVSEQQGSVPMDIENDPYNLFQLEAPAVQSSSSNALTVQNTAPRYVDPPKTYWDRELGRAVNPLDAMRDTGNRTTVLPREVWQTLVPNVQTSTSQPVLQIEQRPRQRVGPEPSTEVVPIPQNAPIQTPLIDILMQALQNPDPKAKPVWSELLGKNDNLRGDYNDILDEFIERSVDPNDTEARGRVLGHDLAWAAHSKDPRAHNLLQEEAHPEEKSLYHKIREYENKRQILNDDLMKRENRQLRQQFFAFWDDDYEKDHQIWLSQRGFQERNFPKVFSKHITPGDQDPQSIINYYKSVGLRHMIDPVYYDILNQMTAQDEVSKTRFWPAPDDHSSWTKLYKGRRLWLAKEHGWSNFVDPNDFIDVNAPAPSIIAKPGTERKTDVRVKIDPDTPEPAPRRAGVIPKRNPLPALVANLENEMRDLDAQLVQMQQNPIPGTGQSSLDALRPKDPEGDRGLIQVKHSQYSLEIKKRVLLKTIEELRKRILAQAEGLSTSDYLQLTAPTTSESSGISETALVPIGAQIRARQQATGPVIRLPSDPNNRTNIPSGAPIPLPGIPQATAALQPQTLGMSSSTSSATMTAPGVIQAGPVTQTTAGDLIQTGPSAGSLVMSTSLKKAREKTGPLKIERGTVQDDTMVTTDRIQKFNEIQEKRKTNLVVAARNRQAGEGEIDTQTGDVKVIVGAPAIANTQQILPSDAADPVDTPADPSTTRTIGTITTLRALPVRPLLATNLGMTRYIQRNVINPPAARREFLTRFRENCVNEGVWTPANTWRKRNKFANLPQELAAMFPYASKWNNARS